MTSAAKVILFPGQGSQFKGMGRELFPLFPSQVRQASEILGYSLEELCLADPNGCLSQTQYTQPALYVVNAMHYLRKYPHSRAGEVPAHADFLAGHSLGEYNALWAAGVFSFETGLRLVKKRGELMSAVHGGGMAAVIGVSALEVQALLERYGFGEIDVANFNAPKQTVIAGEKLQLAAAVECFAAMNIRCVMLNVSAAFHSRHVRPLQTDFAAFLGQFSFAPLSVPVIANATARPYDGERIAETLAMQIASPVHWVDSIRYLMGRGVTEFEEIGASVLSKMVADIKASETPLFDKPIFDKPIFDKHIVDKVRPAVHAASPLIGESAEDARAPVPDVIGSDANGAAPRIEATSLGSEVFRRRFGLKYAYLAGAMYRGVASADLVIRMGRAGFLSFFGAGGLSPAKIEANLVRIQGELAQDQPYGMNLLANHDYPELEAAVVDLYLRQGVRNVEAAAFMQMTPALVRYRLHGLRLGERNELVCDHRIIAKVSRPEVARAFMSPPPAAVVRQLLERGQVTPQQAEWSTRVPMSHDICVEADSGGHTDGGIAAVMLPPLLRMRDEMQSTHGYAEPICMGLAGGIGSPEAAAAAFLLGADFVMTGSINQCTVEAGMSADGKSMLQEIDIQDTEYAPAGDMFEIGAQVQVMKKSVFFPARANKLLSLYRHYESLDDIPLRTRQQLEGTFFKKTFTEIWSETVDYFRSVKLDHEVAKAEANAKHKMALVFRWYFAYCTRIAMEGKGEDRVNYQIHTGPALGSFNQWVKGTELESWDKRHVDHIAVKLMDAAAKHLTQSYARFMGH
ncbi:ACP S-malonyltransferase [Dyella choica]|uniref:[acyl-carrier-protein] S-malonyltransferase n=1 Tax=Dyella choica TaxID=1927959 RepID=A0A432M9M0_9GAMM|nr:ACP S-malonyltransferase [Dyella choica]RUL78906.1 [acyl-carrier-protein] S-malonyltransferase [Dyella choica]